jgi:hypothetical protein
MASTLKKEAGLNGNIAFKNEKDQLVCLLDSTGFPLYMTKLPLSEDDTKLITDTIDELCVEQ